jgi:hypothetical protein
VAISGKILEETAQREEIDAAGAAGQRRILLE